MCFHRQNISPNPFSEFGGQLQLQHIYIKIAGQPNSLRRDRSRSRSYMRSRSRSRDRRIHRGLQQPRYTIYVLKLTQGKYYIGRTRKLLKEIFEEYTTGRLSALWSRKYQLMRIIDSICANTGVTELSITKEYMARYGIDNVRGSCYCRIELTPAERQKLELDVKEIRAQLDLCFNCGGRHYSSKCIQYKDPGNTTFSSHVITLKQLMKMDLHSPTQSQTPEYDNTQERPSCSKDPFTSTVETLCFADIAEDKSVSQFIL